MFKSKYTYKLINNTDYDNCDNNANNTNENANANANVIHASTYAFYEKYLQSKHLLVLCILILIINLCYAQIKYLDVNDKTTEVYSDYINESTITTAMGTATVTVTPSTTTKALFHLSKLPVNLTYSYPTNTTTKTVPTAEKYFINTSQCRVPYIDPFAKETLKIFNPKKFKYSNCTKDEPLITTNYQINMQRYFLHMNMPAIERAVKSMKANATDVRCCYQQIVRVENDDSKYNLLPCVIFHQDFIVPQQIDYMITECYIGSKKTKKTIQKDAFSFVQKRENPGPPSIYTIEAAKAENFGTKRPSILLLGIDSVSRMNLRRTMPKTFKYLQENRWFELQGYNKIGDNTFPNLMALLTSYNSTLAYSKCKPKTVGGLNQPACNLIWNNFKEYGYATAYAEDSWWMSTFNYLKKGFKQPPTDYYLRPMTIAIAKELKTQKAAGLVYCAGRKHYGEYIFDYALQYANALPATPLFGLFWTNSFSHNRFDTTANMDKKMLEYLETMQRDGILERSIVIFFADHGTRWGPLLSLSSGFLEERLPMMFISLPTWYQNEYPHFVEALKINQHRLTSPYDIYATFKHILEETNPEKSFTHSNLNETVQGVSIFREIAENRTCQEAGISDHWCTCIPYEILSKTNGVAKRVTNLVLDEINNYLISKNISKKCSKLTLKSLGKAERKMFENAKQQQQSTFRLTFAANPKAAKFQATALYNEHTNKVEMNVEEISRLDSYASTAGCIDLKVAQKVCICKKVKR